MNMQMVNRESDGWAYCPSNKPPRLIRFVTHSLFGAIAELDEETNVLVIDKNFYDVLNEVDKGRVLKTTLKVVLLQVSYEPWKV